MKKKITIIVLVIVLCLLSFVAANAADTFFALNKDYTMDIRYVVKWVNNNDNTVRVCITKSAIDHRYHIIAYDLIHYVEIEHSHTHIREAALHIFLKFLDNFKNGGQ